MKKPSKSRPAPRQRQDGRQATRRPGPPKRRDAAPDFLVRLVGRTQAEQLFRKDGMRPARD